MLFAEEEKPFLSELLTKEQEYHNKLFPEQVKILGDDLLKFVVYENDEFGLTEIMKIGYSKYTPPKTDDYVYIFKQLQAHKINNLTFYGIINIAFDLKKSNDERFFYGLENMQGPECRPVTLTEKHPFDLTEIDKFFTDSKKPIPKYPRNLEDFKLFMQIYCCFLISFIFKDSLSINKKLSSLSNKLLRNQYQEYMDVSLPLGYRNLLRKEGKNSRVRKNVAGVLVLTYHTYSMEKELNYCYFLDWIVLKNNYQSGFGIVGLVLKILKSYETNYKKLLVMCTTKLTKRSVLEINPVVFKFHKKPKKENSDEEKSWLYFVYSGLFLNENLKKLAFLRHRELSSIFIGILYEYENCRINSFEYTTFKKDDYLPIYVKRGKNLKDAYIPSYVPPLVFSLEELNLIRETLDRPRSIEDFDLETY